MKKYLLSCAILAFLSVPALADSTSFNSGKVYGALNGGALLPTNTDVSFTGTLSGSGKIHYNTGYTFGGTLGYHFNDYIAGEADLSYSRANYDKISGTLNGASGDLDLGGHVSAVTGLLNAVVTPVKNLAFTPYFGGGIGFAATSSKITSVGGVAVTGSDGHKTDFAADVLAGFDVPVNKDVSLGGRYQYVWINSSQSDTSSLGTEHDGNFGASVITARATFHF
jgi:opacity protein-like surface antigen